MAKFKFEGIDRYTQKLYALEISSTPMIKKIGLGRRENSCG